MKKLRTFWEANFLTLEFVLALGSSVCFAVWSETINRTAFISHIFSGSREVLYGTLAALFGSMLGFIITAVSIILGYATNDKLEIVRKGKHYSDLWDTFNSAIKVLGVSTVVAIIGLVADKNSTPINFILYVNIFFLYCPFSESHVACGYWNILLLL